MDPQIFLWQKYGGVSQLFVELLRYAREWNDPEITCPLTFTENIHLIEAGLAPKNVFSGLGRLNFRGTGRVKDFVKSLSIRKTKRLLKDQDFDIFFPSYYDTYFLDYLSSKPLVIVVHDMIHEIFPEYFLNDKTTVPNKKLLIERATRIITNSHCTKNDILRIYPDISEKKIVPVHHAQSIENPGMTTNQIDLPEKYILFVGNRSGYKNFNFMINALTPIFRTKEKLHLVCAGGGSFSAGEKQFISNLGIDKKIIQIDFEDKQLPGYYKNALVFIFPSLYEGFGIPTLEAMKCGCPVILANNSCFPEIAGDAAVYFDPYNSASLVEATTNILNDENLRNNFIEKGYERVSSFSWEKTAKGYFKAISEII